MRLIVTNGDATLARLRAAGVTDDILPWRDALHDGPVPGGLPLPALSAVRARFLAGEFGLPPERVAQRFAERDQAIAEHDRYDRIELWFEHDLYDQLQLVQLLAVFAAAGRTRGLLLVQAADHLGDMPEDELRGLAARAVEIDADETGLAERIWAAFTASSPEALAALAFSPLHALPHAGPALRRLLAELPALGSGLSLTEARALAALRAAPRATGPLFAIVQRQEEARFLGDASFFRRLDGLAFAPVPLVEGLPFPFARAGAGSPEQKAFAGATLSVTEAGRAALAEAFDHAARNRVERWIGGTHVTPANPWRRGHDGRPLLAA